MFLKIMHFANITQDSNIYIIMYEIFCMMSVGGLEVEVKKEAPTNFLSDPREDRSTLCPTNILVYNWSKNKQACFDNTGVLLIVGFCNGIFEVGKAANSVVTAKEEKHSEACKATHHSFIPFAFNTSRS